MRNNGAQKIIDWINVAAENILMGLVMIAIPIGGFLVLIGLARLLS